MALDAPSAVSTPVYRFSLLGPLALSAALGIQLLFLALFVVEPPARDVEELSDWGVLFTHPEWDIAFYVASIGFTGLAGAALVSLWNRRLRAAPAPSERWLVAQSAMQAAVAAMATAAFLNRFLEARGRAPVTGQLPALGAGRVAVFVLIASVTLAAALAARTGAGAPGSREPLGYLKQPEGTRKRRRWSAWDLLIPPVIVAAIFVATPQEVAGRVFVEETLLHWDYFAMGPALAYDHGLALGSEVHSAYGVGWPLVFSALSDWIPLSYGSMIQAASVYSCLYFLGIYVLLRLVVRRPGFAFAGTLLAMLPYFVAMQGLISPRVPNVTAMRWPMDVWCFLSLAVYARSGRRAWAAAAGALNGLAIVFVIDTGMELAAAVAFFWLCVLIGSPDRGRAVRDLAAAVAVAFAVLLAGLAIAGRGAIFSADFVKGWLEAPLEFGGGFGMLPITIMGEASTIAALSVLYLVYLTQAGYSLNRSRHRAEGGARPFDLVAGLLAAYGALVLVKYLGHSAELIFYRLLMPAAVLAAVLGDRAAGHLERLAGRTGSPARRRAALAAPAVAAVLVAGMAVAGPAAFLVDDFLAYPNLVSARVSPTPEGLCLIPEPRDLCGLPPEMAEPVAGVHRIVERLRELTSQGHTFAVIDETGSLFHAATGTAPYGRYSRIFATMPTKRLVTKVQSGLDRDPPDYVLTRVGAASAGGQFDQWSSFGPGPAPRDESFYGDSWEAMLEVVHRRYVLDDQVGPYQLWRLKDPG